MEICIGDTPMFLSQNMILRINPGQWTFNIPRVPWTWETNDEDMIVFKARGYNTSVWNIPINADDHLPSGFVVDVDGEIIFRDKSIGGGYLIYLDQVGDYVTAITLCKNPDYDEMSDLEGMMGRL